MRVGVGGIPALALAALLALPAAGCAQQEGNAPREPDAAPALTGSITDVAGIEVGHHTLAERPTGCTVILSRGGAVGGVDVRGGAPGTRDTDLLDPVNLVTEVHGVVLSGGSLFGLDAVSGAVRWLEEHGTGLDAWGTTIPIVMVRAVRRPRANGCGRYPSSSAALSTLSTVLSETTPRVCGFSAREAVEA